MRNRILLTLLLAGTVTACASTRQAQEVKESLLCKTEPGLLDCLVEALAAMKQAEVEAFCQQIEGRSSDHDLICAITVPVAFWMRDQKDRVESHWGQECQGAPLPTRADAVVASVLIYTKALEQQRVDSEDLKTSVLEAAIAFSSGCGVSQEAVGVLMGSVGQEMSARRVAWPEISCEKTPSCLSALQP